MKLELITLLGQKMNEDVYEVILPTAEGPIAVYPGHEPLVTLAVPGVMKVRRKKYDRDEHLDYFAMTDGVAEINGTRVRILVDEAESSEELVEEEVREALKLAQEHRAKAKDQVDIEKAQHLIDRHEVRLKVAELKRRRHRQI